MSRWTQWEDVTEESPVHHRNGPMLKRIRVVNGWLYLAMPFPGSPVSSIAFVPKPEWMDEGNDE